jgi:hypothetical protein
MFVRSTALLAMVVLAAGCSSSGSNTGITGAVPPASEYVGASIGSATAPQTSFSIAGSTGLPSAQGNSLTFAISENATPAYTGTFTVVPSPASCITVKSPDGMNFTATAKCSTLPSTGNFTVSDTTGNTAPLVITATP